MAGDNGGPHTPTPWLVSNSHGLRILSDSDYGAVADLGDAHVAGGSEQAWADADFIVRAANSHEALVEALRGCDGAFATWQVGGIPGRPEDILGLVTKVRAALKLAEET